LAELTLNTQIPLVHVSWLKVGLRAAYKSVVGQERRIGSVHAETNEISESRDGIPAGISLPRVGKCPARHSDRGPERLGRVFLTSVQHAGAVAIHPVRGADRHPAVTLGIPGQTQAGEKLLPVRAIEVAAAGILRV